MESLRIKVRPDSARVFLAASMLLPSSRTTTGSFRAVSLAAATIPVAPPNNGTSTVEGAGGTGGTGGTAGTTQIGGGSRPPPPAPKPRRFHGTVQLDPTRTGRDASRIADEIIAHLAGQIGAEVTVTLEIEAVLPEGASDQIVRTVTENSRTLKFTSQGFEKE